MRKTGKEESENGKDTSRVADGTFILGSPRPDPAYGVPAAADGQAGPNMRKFQMNVVVSGSDRCQGRCVTEVAHEVVFVFPTTACRSCSSEAEFLAAAASQRLKRTARPDPGPECYIFFGWPWSDFPFQEDAVKLTPPR